MRTKWRCLAGCLVPEVLLGSGLFLHLQSRSRGALQHDSLSESPGGDSGQNRHDWKALIPRHFVLMREDPSCHLLVILCLQRWEWTLDVPDSHFSFFFHFSFIIHMCIQGLVHFSPLPPDPSFFSVTARECFIDSLPVSNCRNTVTCVPFTWRSDCKSTNWTSKQKNKTLAVLKFPFF
jgi:hypothetical protein